MHAALGFPLILWLTTGLFVATVGEAQEVIVSRLAMSDDCGVAVPPAVQLRKRADNVVQSLLLSDDTRHEEARLAELAAALERLGAAAAAHPAVSVALLVTAGDGLELVRPFDRADAVAAIAPGNRPDTSQVRLLAKTAITAGDPDLARPAARISAFLASLELPGRAQVEPLGEPALTIVDPGRYRREVTAAIAADVGQLVAQLGAGYGAQLTGLERPVEWVQVDELELGLYLPYQLTISR